MVGGFRCWMVTLEYLGFGVQLCDGPDRGLGEDRRIILGPSLGLDLGPWYVIHSFTFQQLPRLVTKRHPPSTHCRIGPAQPSQAEKFLSLSIFSFNKIRKPGVAVHACHPRTGEPGAARSPELEPSPDYNTVSSRLVDYKVSPCIKE